MSISYAVFCLKKKTHCASPPLPPAHVLLSFFFVVPRPPQLPPPFPYAPLSRSRPPSVRVITTPREPPRRARRERERPRASRRRQRPGHDAGRGEQRVQPGVA